MKTLLDSNGKLVSKLILLLLAVSLSVQWKQQIRKGSRTPRIKSLGIDCPSCGLRSKPEALGTSNLECQRFYIKHKHNSNNDELNSLLPSYNCKCKYKYVDKKSCGSRGQQNDEIESSEVSGDCLVAHVGMAVRGSNLLYRKWVSKENCFNLCMRTRISNGHSFDCASFEHWHRDCDSRGPDDKENQICASFTETERNKQASTNQIQYNRNYFKQNRYYYKSEQKTSRYNKKRASKTDICVLSNQTISLAGSNFLPNDAVTYYEILCKINQANTETSTISSTASMSTSKNRTSSIPAYLLNKFAYKESTEKKTIPERVQNDLNMGQRCQFNPCLNGGACLLIDTFRFTCLCKDFYYGVYCEIHGIQKVCHNTLMEITINNELTTNLNIHMFDLFVNRKSNQLACQIQDLNNTHSRFSIPYNMCSTVKSNINGETIYTNKLFSKIKTHSPGSADDQMNGNHYLYTLECTLESQVSTYLSPDQRKNLTEKDSSNELITQEQARKKKSCLIDLFQLRMRLFFDKHHSLAYDSVTSNNVEYEQDMNVQFFVEYSDRLNQLYEMHEKLQYLHLTLLHCWLSSGKDSYTDVQQILVENGCPKDDVHFFDSSIVKNSIQFRFRIKRPEANLEVKKYFIHCDPEICTDPPADRQDNVLFFKKFKACKNISALCDAKSRNVKYALTTPTDKKNLAAPMELFQKISRCNNTLVEGPLFIGKTKRVLTGFGNNSGVRMNEIKNYFVLIVVHSILLLKMWYFE